MQLERVSVKNKTKLTAITQFLESNDLKLDSQIEYFVIVYRFGEILACGGIAGNIFKCIAIRSELRGEGLAIRLLTEMVNFAYELNRPDLFIYTKPENETVFNQCGFYTIAEAYPNVVLLENSSTRLAKQCAKWQAKRVAGDKIGAIVMNANPFTLGHRYLIEQALAQCDHLHLFIVSENASQFSFQDRFSLVKQGIADLDRITLHQGSDYIISRATFPNYFLKDQGLTDDCYLELDLKLFRQHIAPSLGITHRFVGSEPICEVTAEYNRKMAYWLQQAPLESPSICVIELERTTLNDEPISASKVRKLLAIQDFERLADLVPATTLQFLQEKYPTHI